MTSIAIATEKLSKDFKSVSALNNLTFEVEQGTTVRQAYQRMILPFFGLILLPIAGISIMPRDFLANLYSPEFVQTNLTGLLFISTLILLLLDALVLSITFTRFKRARLLMD